VSGSVAYDFTGAQVLVTGGSNGIGLGIATAFAAADARVTITGTRDAADDYDHDLAAFEYRQCVMTDPEQIAALAAWFDGLDVLVNNAGQNLPRGKSEYDPDVFDEVVAVNLSAAFRLSQLCRPLLAGSSLAAGGSVVNIASMASFFGVEIVPGYGAAKAGVVQMTKTLGVAWAKQGIRVNAVAPGVIETNMTAPMMPFDFVTKPMLDRTPMARFGTPDDIAPVALFLCSDAARYMTGHTVIVDGGFSVQG
jgi:3-oxoacyl-[acyl-carrier protein] reductase